MDKQHVVNLNEIISHSIDHWLEPLFLQDGCRVRSWNEGKKFAGGCVHSSWREAEKCGHDHNDWDNNTTDCIILYEGDK